MFDGQDLMISTSYKRLQSNIEPIDVRAGIPDVFDSDGRRVTLETKWSRIYATVDSQQPAASEEFSGKLRDYLRAVRDSAADDPRCDLPCLMQAAMNRA